MNTKNPHFAAFLPRNCCTTKIVGAEKKILDRYVPRMKIQNVINHRTCLFGSNLYCRDWKKMSLHFFLWCTWFSESCKRWSAKTSRNSTTKNALGFFKLISWKQLMVTHKLQQKYFVKNLLLGILGVVLLTGDWSCYAPSFFLKRRKKKINKKYLSQKCLEKKCQKK